MLVRLTIVLVALAIAVPVQGREPIAAAVPHLLLTPEITARLRAAATSDPETARRLAELRHKAEDILERPLLAEVFETTYHGKPATLLQTSRQMFKRATVLGLAWNLWGHERYATRGRQELLAVAAFDNWNPAHFLDTAEMSAAVALGLDWFTAYLSDADKRRLVAALVDKGIRPGLQLYQDAEGKGVPAWVEPRARGFTALSPTAAADLGWPLETFNWNIVCNAGLTIAALAVRPFEPVLADALLRHSLASIRRGFAEYAADGGFSEGADYWAYATRYAAMFNHAVGDVLGPDAGYADAPGFGNTGDFALHLIGPSGLAFNFADSELRPNLVALAWLSERYGRPVDAWLNRQASPGSRLALDLIWRVSDEGRSPVAAQVPTARLFADVNVATFRSAWLDPMALFAGFKGGDNHGHHAHLDLGSFVLDGLGQRWAIDLGPGRYSLPGYFGKQRWDYYRTGTAGQNTLMFAGQNQNPDAQAPLTAFRHTPDVSFAIADLGQAYDVPAASVRRGLALLGDRRFLVQDEIGGDKPQSVRWSMHTAAAVVPGNDDAATLTLNQGGQNLAARIVAPVGARFAVHTATPPPPQQANPGVSNVVIDLDAVAAGTARRIVVVLEPGVTEVSGSLAVVPLAQWPDRLRP